MSSKREWLIGRQGHTGMLTLDELAGLIRAGQLRADEMVKRQGQPWRAAREVPELGSYFGGPVAGGPFIPEDRTIMFPSSPAASAPPPTGRFSEPTPPSTPAVQKRDPDPAPIVEPPKNPAPDPVPLATAPVKPSVYDPAPPVAATSPSPARQGTPMGERDGSDFVGDVALAFGWKQVAAVFVLLLATFVVSSVLFAAWREWAWKSPRVHWTLDRIPWTLLGAGTLVAFAVAVCMTRRGMEPGSRGAVATDIVRIGPALATLAIGTLLLCGVALGGLWILAQFRNWGTGSATILRILQIVPILVATIGVAAALAGTLGIAYAAAASVVEGCGAGEAFKKVRAIATNAGRRLATHAFGIAGAVALAIMVCISVFGYVWSLVDKWPPPPGEIEQAWSGHWFMGAVYEGGLLPALVGTLPVSLAATLSVVSYLSLRRYAGEAK